MTRSHLFWCLLISFLLLFLPCAAQEDNSTTSQPAAGDCRTDSGITCPSCLAIDGCQWSVGGCSAECLNADACYSHQIFPDNTTEEICLMAVQVNVDFVICNQPTDCTTCLNTTVTGAADDGGSTSSCIWTEAGYCKKPDSEDCSGDQCGVETCPTGTASPTTATSAGTNAVTGTTWSFIGWDGAWKTPSFSIIVFPALIPLLF